MSEDNTQHMHWSIRDILQTLVKVKGQGQHTLLLKVNTLLCRRCIADIRKGHRHGVMTFYMPDNKGPEVKDQPNIIILNNELQYNLSK
jgi:hypothetical protein